MLLLLRSDWWTHSAGSARRVRHCGVCGMDTPESKDWSDRAALRPHWRRWAANNFPPSAYTEPVLPAGVCVGVCVWTLCSEVTDLIIQTHYVDSPAIWGQNSQFPPVKLFIFVESWLWGYYIVLTNIVLLILCVRVLVMLVRLSNLCEPSVSGDKTKTNEKIHAKRFNRLNCPVFFCGPGSASWLTLWGVRQWCEERKRERISFHWIYNRWGLKTSRCGDGVCVILCLPLGIEQWWHMVYCLPYCLSILDVVVNICSKYLLLSWSLCRRKYIICGNIILIGFECKQLQWP